MALIAKDGLLQVRIPKADAEAFRELCEKRHRKPPGALLREWVWEALDREKKRLQGAVNASTGPCRAAEQAVLLDVKLRPLPLSKVRVDEKASKKAKLARRKEK
jgi:hypothetical protein